MLLNLLMRDLTIHTYHDVLILLLKLVNLVIPPIFLIVLFLLSISYNTHQL